MIERLIAGVAPERREARVVVVEPRMVRVSLEARANRVERIGVALLCVRTHRVAVERPRFSPVKCLVRLARCGTNGENCPVPCRLPPRFWADKYECPSRRVDRMAVDLECRIPVEHDVQLLLA